MKVTKIQYDLVTRLPGSPFIVVCRKTYVADSSYELSAVGYDDNDVEAARVKAEKAVDELAERHIKSFQTLQTVLRKLSTPQRSTPNPSQATPTKEQQEKIDQLTEVLGLPRIDISNWTVGEAMILYHTLSSLV